MAYQIKIIVKNSKPPIWRRMTIPNGITFSQLGLIINEVFGLEWSDNFRFEFYQRKVQLEEEKEGEVFQPNFHYDLQEASNTYIDDYFEEKEWCSYYLGNKSFRVEIEEIICEEVLLLVLKAKGEFPNCSLDCLELMKRLEQKFEIITTEEAHFEKQEVIVQENQIKLYRTNNPQSALAEKIANELLSRSEMKKNFSIYTDEEIEAFEYAMEQEGAFSPSDEIWDRLVKPAEKDYISVYEDDSMEMPIDVKEAYKKVNTKEFHQFRKKKVWLIDCLKMVDKLYIVAPVDVLLRMYRKRKGYRLSKKEIMDLLKMIPEEEMNCVFYDNRIMGSDFRKNARYKEVERSQGDKPFYIPTYEETIDYVRNLYPSREPVYQKLKKFFMQDMKMSTYAAEYFVIDIYNMVSMGAGLSDIINMLNENDIVFNNQNEFVKIAEILIQLINDTRMVSNRGYKPNEMAQGEFEAIRRSGRMPTIVPGSSQAAQMLMQGKDEIQKMGFHLDFDSNAKEVPVTTISGDRTKAETTVKKVYPNDPCPCGSGKKYKKCCGSNY